MARAAIDEYLYLLDAAFAGPDWHSLLTNVRAVEPRDWLWLPPGGARPIAEMVAHVGACKYMYENHAFGDAALSWGEPLTNERRLTTVTADAVAELLSWLESAQRRLRASVDALDDDRELLKAASHELGRDERHALDHQDDHRARPLSRRRDQPDAGAAPGERPLGVRELDPEDLTLLRAELLVCENAVTVKLRELHKIVEAGR